MLDKTAPNSPGIAADDTSFVDARPEHRVSSRTTWADAVERREQFARLIEEELARLHLKANLLRSQNGTYPVWVRLEAWLPAREGVAADVSDARIRCALQFVIDIKPFNEHPLTVSAEAFNGRRKLSVTNRPRFDERMVREWVAFAVAGGSRPSNHRPVLDALVSMMTAMIPFVRGPHSNRVQRHFRNGVQITIYAALLVVGAIAMFGAIIDLSQPIYLQSGAGGIWLLVGFALLVAGLIIMARRQKVVAVIDRPNIPPRSLSLVDGWYAVIPDLGEKLDDVRRRIADKLKAVGGTALSVEEETYTFRSPNGHEMRQRLVVSKGQGVGHVHIYRFGPDVFVGWDSYMNWAKWGETSAVSSRSTNRQVMEFRSLQEQLYIPSQYDLIDLNALGEVMHRVVTDEVKLLMKENDIDQEIDFQIIRGSRDEALDKDRHDRRKKAESGASGGGRRRAWKIS